MKHQTAYRCRQHWDEEKNQPILTSMFVAAPKSLVGWPATSLHSNLLPHFQDTRLNNPTIIHRSRARVLVRWFEYLSACDNQMHQEKSWIGMSVGAPRMYLATSRPFLHCYHRSASSGTQLKHRHFEHDDFDFDRSRKEQSSRDEETMGITCCN